MLGLIQILYWLFVSSVLSSLVLHLIFVGFKNLGKFSKTVRLNLLTWLRYKLNMSGIITKACNFSFRTKAYQTSSAAHDLEDGKGD